MKRLKLLFSLFTILAFSISCEQDDYDLKEISTIEIIKPIEIEENNKRTKFVYQNGLIVNIYIEKENSLPENYPLGMLYKAEFEKDTFSFEYKDGVLLNVNRIHHEVSFKGSITRIEEQNHIEYYSNNMIKSISFSNPLAGKRIFIYDNLLRLSKIEYKYENSSISSPPISLTYNNNSNLISYCIYSDLKCSDASQYDNHSNPYYSINQLLGYPFFSNFQHLSRNNPLRINNAMNKVTLFDIEFSYEYDDRGRVIKINDTIKFKY